MTRAQLLGVTAGVVIAVLLPSSGWAFVLSASLGLGVTLLLWMVRITGRVDNPSDAPSSTRRARRIAHLTKGLVIFLCTVVGVGLASGQYYVHGLANIKKIQLERVSGCIVTSVVNNNGAYRFGFESAGRTLLGRSIRYRVTWYKPEKPLVAGSCWRVTLRLKPLRGSRNEVGFDYERWLFAQRLNGLGSVKVGVPAVKLPWRSANARYLMARTRLYEHLAKVTNGYASGMLIGALAVGKRDNLSSDDWEVLKRTGTAHLMAISGLHVGLAAILGFALGRYLPVLVRPDTDLNRRGAFTSLLVATLYSAVAGFAVSTVRALVMLILWHLCRFVRRSVDVTTTLLLTVVSVLVLCPWMAADTGFWLSVGAVTAITAAVFGRPPATTIADRIRLAMRIQFGITLLMLPIAVLVAEGVSWISMPVNLILIPLFSFCVVPLVLLLLASLAVIPAIVTPVATVLGEVLDVVWELLVWLAAQPWAFTSLAAVSPWLTIPVAVCGVIVLLPPAFPARWTGYALVLPLFFSRTEHPDYGEFRLDVLDVGQALAIIVQTQSSTVIYDTGNAWPGGDSAEQAILPVLRKRRVAGLDAMIISHADRDHSGGAVRIQQSMPVDEVWVGEPVDRLTRSRPCASGIRWEYDGVNFEFLHPPANSTYEGNQQSCVLLIQGTNSSALLTGDLGQALERRLLPALEGQQSIDVVVGAHHGSLSSSDQRFVEFTRPAFVVFSNGFGNQWGMPRDEIVSRWQLAGAQVLTTAGSGQLSFKSRNEGRLTLEQQLREQGLGAWRWRSRPR